MAKPSNNGGGNTYSNGRANCSWGNKTPNASGSPRQGSSSSAAPAAASTAGARSANVKTTGRPPAQATPSSPLTPPSAASSTGLVSHQKSDAAAVAAASTGVGGVGTTAAKTLLSCEPCEKEFTSEVARQAHLQSHVPCPEKGCGFSALRKFVNNHFEAKHGQCSGSGFQVGAMTKSVAESRCLPTKGCFMYIWYHIIHRRMESFGRSVELKGNWCTAVVLSSVEKGLGTGFRQVLVYVMIVPSTKRVGLSGKG